MGLFRKRSGRSRRSEAQAVNLNEIAKQDRLLKQLPLGERRRQVQIRQAVVNDLPIESVEAAWGFLRRNQNREEQ